MSTVAALSLISTIRETLAEAASSLMDSVDECRGHIRAARAGDASALERAELSLFAMLETCAFEDLTGQRLSQLAGMLDRGAGAQTRAGDPLLNGPASKGQGLDQAAADALLRRD